MRTLPNFLAKRPNIVELDFAGTVIDPNDTSFKAGDRVWGFLQSQGALAQYITATEKHTALRPDNLTLEEAAGLGCVGLTAQQAIFKFGDVQPGQSVFVVGGGLTFRFVMSQSSHSSVSLPRQGALLLVELL